jgi:anti-sigma factor RsiW
MSFDPSPLDPRAETPALEEELVAYLDHELDAEAHRRIEQLLATDPKVRQTLQQLERAWDALDQLHRVEVDEHFTRSTLEMVAVAASGELETIKRRTARRRVLGWLAGTAGLVAVGVAGFLVTVGMWPDPNEQLLRDLPVLERLDQYRQIDDIEFLRLLRNEGLFTREDSDGG